MIVPDDLKIENPERLIEILIFRRGIEKEIKSAQDTIKRNAWIIQVLQEICPHEGVERVGGQSLHLLRDCPFCGKRRAVPVG